jgi:opacity protein-like surface antigen
MRNEGAYLQKAPDVLSGISTKLIKCKERVMTKGFLRTAVFALLFAGLAAGASAQITISGGFALSSINNLSVSGSDANIDTSVGVGGNVYLDYLLPINIPLSLGFEAGVDGGNFTIKGMDGYNNPHNYDETMLAIPLLLRAAYHFDFSPKLDLYLVGKIGMAFGIWTGDFKDELDKDTTVKIDTIMGFAFGFDAGIAYYFTPRFGIFGEVGFDDYLLKTKITIDNSYYSQIDTSIETLKAPFNRFITFGISTKF